MISIVTGTLNRLPFLPGLIKNCLASPLTELILVDGGSSDGTQAYLKGLNHPRMKLVEMGHRSSWSSFMNIGIEASTHEVVCQWNDDVLLLPSWEEVAREMDEAHDIYIFSWKTGTVEQSTDPAWLALGEFKDGLSDNGWRCNGRLVNYGLYRKSVFRKAGLYHEGYRFYHADSDMTERAIHSGFADRIKVLPNMKVLDIKCDHKVKHGLNATEREDIDLFYIMLSRYKTGGGPKEIRRLA